MEEQEIIARFLDFKTAQIDTLIRAMGGADEKKQSTKNRNMSRLLLEYRTALITNAVTGKIDVRKAPIQTDVKDLG